MTILSRVGAFALVLGFGFAGPALASPISDKYAALGGASFLGAPTGPETTAPDGVGKYRHYQKGSIYWSPQTAAHEVHGLILQKWAALGWEKSYLGYPMTDELNTYEGVAGGPARVSKFQGGELIWRRDTNAVSEVKSTDLVIDLPTRAGEPWFVIQANGIQNGDSHFDQWAYCWDLDWNKDQPNTKGKPFFAGAGGRIAWVSEDQHNTQNQKTAPLANVISQRLGPGRYLSYMHLLQGSYTKEYGKGQMLFSPQALPWTDRPVVKDGQTLAQTGDVGAAWGAYHVHYCVTTSPDRPQFAPFESVPVSFRNYSSSDDGGQHWTYHAVGVPRRGQLIRKEAFKPGEGPSPQVGAVDVLNYGTVSATLDYSGAALGPGGTLTATLVSSWGEPLATRKVTTGASGHGPWKVTFNAPDYPGSKVEASYDKPPSGYTVSGQSGTFSVTADQTSNVTVHLKAVAIPVIR